MVYLPPQLIVAEPIPVWRGCLTLADAIAAVETWHDIPQKRRITKISALRKLERVYGKPPEAIRLDPEELTRRFLKASPKALGLKPGSLAVYKNHIRTVLRRLGVIEDSRRRKSLTPAWEALRKSLPDRFLSVPLQGLIAWGSDHGIPPDAVNDPTLAKYGGYLKANRMKGNPVDIVRRCAKAWNRAAQTVPGWPATELTAPASSFFYTLPFEAYSASLVADVEKFRHRLEGDGKAPGLYTASSASSNLRPASVKNRLQGIRMALAALVHSGIPPEDIPSLAVIVRPDHMKTILDWHWDRAGNKVTGNLGVIAETLRIIAKYHVGLTEEALGEAVAIAKTAKPTKRRRMTAKNEGRLAQFDDEIITAITMNLAREELMPLAARQKALGRHLQAAWTASLAVAIEIELHCPMRLANLTNLRLGQEIVCLGNSKQRFTHFLIEGHLTKNEEPLRWPINARLSTMLDTFVTKYRGAIGGARSEYLFAGRDYDDRPRAASRLGTTITETFWDYSIELNPHLFRALAGKWILDENPGGIEEVRQLLGHRTFATAMEYYISSQSQRAAVRHDERIGTKQRETRLQAKFAFSSLRSSGRSLAAKGAFQGGQDG